jgi:hypothetical protein
MVRCMGKQRLRDYRRATVVLCYPSVGECEVGVHEWTMSSQRPRAHWLEIVDKGIARARR